MKEKFNKGVPVLTFVQKIMHSFSLDNMLTPLQNIQNDYGIELFIKKEYLNHPLVQGNKWHKVRPNMEAAVAQKSDVLLTFGGAFSNHLHAVAAAGLDFRLPTIGIVRGTAVDFNNPTLSACATMGMQLFNIDKKTFDAICMQDGITEILSSLDFYKKIKEKYKKIYMLPMGGSNALGIQGCADFGASLYQQIQQLGIDFSKKKLFIGVSAGSGGTAAGLLVGFKHQAQILAFPPMKGSLEKAEILNHIHAIGLKSSTYENDLTIIPETHFKGFGKMPPELLHFSTDFKAKYGIPLDLVYTAKMLFNVEKLIQNDYFSKESVLVMVHTGGLRD